MIEYIGRVYLEKMQYSKSCLKWSLKNRQIKGLKKTGGSLVQVQSIGECSQHSAILLTCTEQLLVLMGLLLNDHLRQVLLYNIQYLLLLIH